MNQTLKLSAEAPPSYPVCRMPFSFHRHVSVPVMLHCSEAGSMSMGRMVTSSLISFHLRYHGAGIPHTINYTFLLSSIESTRALYILHNAKSHNTNPHLLLEETRTTALVLARINVSHFVNLSRTPHHVCFLLHIVHQFDPSLLVNR